MVVFGSNIYVKRPKIWNPNWQTHIPIRLNNGIFDEEFRVILIDGSSYREFDMLLNPPTDFVLFMPFKIKTNGIKNTDKLCILPQSFNFDMNQRVRKK